MLTKMLLTCCTNIWIISITKIWLIFIDEVVNVNRTVYLNSQEKDNSKDNFFLKDENSFLDSPSPSVSSFAMILLTYFYSYI